MSTPADIEKVRRLLREIQARTFSDSLSGIHDRADEALRALGENGEEWRVGMICGMYNPFYHHGGTFVVDCRNGETNVALAQDRHTAHRIARLPALERALNTISRAFWSENEPHEDRVADLQQIARAALKQERP